MVTNYMARVSAETAFADGVGSPYEPTIDALDMRASTTGGKQIDP
jgi:hypothetical protein